MIEQSDYDNLINNIYLFAQQINPDLDKTKLFATIALYYKYKYKRPHEKYPDEYFGELYYLVKDPKETDIRYLMNILKSKNPYVIAIKEAEFEATENLKKKIVIENWK